MYYGGGLDSRSAGRRREDEPGNPNDAPSPEVAKDHEVEEATRWFHTCVPRKNDALDCAEGRPNDGVRAADSERGGGLLCFARSAETDWLRTRSSARIAGRESFSN